ncbi:hypothetical protein J1N35_044200 [Gossypium stocksii]|uniref:Uncharacterized protein n=1 Tax=Gossypium stocksii TaxID=47602 RepID=A0A9D3U926_9ROSI|nr:hypothetical protein J1N35_044200 [Gossypium stocksii]
MGKRIKTPSNWKTAHKGWPSQGHKGTPPERRRLITHANAKSKSEKFPPSHRNRALGVYLGASQHIGPAFVPPHVPFSSTLFTSSKEPIQTWSGPLINSTSTCAPRKKKHVASDSLEPSKPLRSQTDKNGNTLDKR